MHLKACLYEAQEGLWKGVTLERVPSSCRHAHGGNVGLELTEVAHRLLLARGEDWQELWGLGDAHGMNWPILGIQVLDTRHPAPTARHQYRVSVPMMSEAIEARSRLLLVQTWDIIKHC